MKLLSVKEYAKIEGITPQAVYLRIEKKSVNFIKVDKTYLIKEEKG
tara:strand:- start:1399 stop:1536 length:138 start_codon:yes stop_codon:yes gene_type:complete